MPDSEADYIIVGGGLTGCAVAARLQNGNPSFRVLVLEAGADATETLRPEILRELLLLQAQSWTTIIKLRPSLIPTTVLTP